MLFKHIRDESFLTWYHSYSAQNAPSATSNNVFPVNGGIRSYLLAAAFSRLLGEEL